MAGKDDPTYVRPLAFVLPPFMTIQQYKENRNNLLVERAKKEKEKVEKEKTSDKENVVRYKRRAKKSPKKKT